MNYFMGVLLGFLGMASLVQNSYGQEAEGEPEYGIIRFVNAVNLPTETFFHLNGKSTFGKGLAPGFVTGAFGRVVGNYQAKISNADTLCKEHSFPFQIKKDATVNVIAYLSKRKKDRKERIHSEMDVFLLPGRTKEEGKALSLLLLSLHSEREPIEVQIGEETYVLERKRPLSIPLEKKEELRVRVQGRDLGVLQLGEKYQHVAVFFAGEEDKVDYSLFTNRPYHMPRSRRKR